MIPKKKNFLPSLEKEPEMVLPSLEDDYDDEEIEQEETLIDLSDNDLENYQEEYEDNSYQYKTETEEKIEEVNNVDLEEDEFEDDYDDEEEWVDENDTPPIKSNNVTKKQKKSLKIDFSKYSKYIYIGIGVLVILLIMFFAFKMLSRNKTKNNENTNEYKVSSKIESIKDGTVNVKVKNTGDKATNVRIELAATTNEKLIVCVGEAKIDKNSNQTINLTCDGEVPDNLDKKHILFETYIDEEKKGQ